MLTNIDKYKLVTVCDGLFDITLYIDNSYRVIPEKASPSVTHGRNPGKYSTSHFANRHAPGNCRLS